MMKLIQMLENKNSKAGSDTISFLELMEALIKEYGSWPEYTKAVMSIENEQVSTHTIDKVYKLYMETDSMQLLNPEIDELLAAEEV